MPIPSCIHCGNEMAEADPRPAERFIGGTVKAYRCETCNVVRVETTGAPVRYGDMEMRSAVLSVAGCDWTPGDL